MNKRLIKSNDEGGVATSFNTVLYTGSGSAGNAITGVGFQPDLVWGKQRNSSAQSHVLVDSVRGRERGLFSNTTNAEVNYDGNSPAVYLSSFDTDGFTLGFGTGLNQSGISMVAWCWKAGGAAVSNTDGTITSQVSANVEAGFSVVKFTGSAGATVGHGLDSAPSVIIVKSRTAANGWSVYHIALGSSGYIELNSTAASSTISNSWGSGGVPNSTVFGTWTTAGAGNNNGNLIAYCFAEVAGFSKFGSYTGTGAVGNTVTVGFEPAFVMLKRSNGTGDWFIYDNKRASNRYLRPNLSNSEGADGGVVFSLNAFTINVTYQDHNESGGTYIYMAFANQF
jgi:hypothetical protein